MGNPNTAVSNTNQGPVIADLLDGDGLTIETSFGPVTFRRENSVTMPQGLLGFAEYKDFGLVNLEDRFGHFKLLQCLTEHSLSFLVLPLDSLADAIAPADLDEAMEALDYPRDQTAFLLIVTARKAIDGVALSVNLRAPLALNVERQVGRQIVLSNNEYPIRHVISGPGIER